MEVIQNNFYEFLVGGFFGIVTYFIRSFYNQYKQTQIIKRKLLENESQEQKLIKEGLLALLRYEINNLCDKMENETTTNLDYNFNLKSMFEAYNLLNGNGRTELRVKKILEKYYD